MKYEWDEAKRHENLKKHLIDFRLAEGFEWVTATIETSIRHGETRHNAIGYINNRLYHIVFVDRSDRRRVISLRKANRREEKRYAEA